MDDGAAPAPHLPGPWEPEAAVFSSPHCVVWRAVGPDGPVALKVPRSADARARLSEEASALRQVRHPGLVRCIDACPDGGWLATRWVEGPPADVWARGRPVDEVVGAVAAVADTLAAVHAAGGVHGDVKPDNILVADSGPVLIDLSLGAVQGPGFFGTPGFAAPEQLRGGPPAPACDAFALGVTLFQLLTGGHPFSAEPRAQALVPLQRLAWTPGLVRARCPVDLDALTLALLHRDPARRPSDLAAVARRLRGALEGPVARPAPGVFAAWRQVGAWLLRALGPSGGALVVHGGRPASRERLRGLLRQAARLEGLGVADREPPRGERALVCLDGRAADGRVLDLWRRRRLPVVCFSPRPRPALLDRGVAHARLPAGPTAVDPLHDRLLAALSNGPQPVGALAEALGLGSLDLLDRAEPLLLAGVVEEADAGRALALAPTPPTPRSAPATR